MQDKTMQDKIMQDKIMQKNPAREIMRDKIM